MNQALVCFGCDISGHNILSDHGKYALTEALLKLVCTKGFREELIGGSVSNIKADFEKIFRSLVIGGQLRREVVDKLWDVVLYTVGEREKCTDIFNSNELAHRMGEKILKILYATVAQ